MATSPSPLVTATGGYCHLMTPWGYRPTTQFACQSHSATARALRYDEPTDLPVCPSCLAAWRRYIDNQHRWMTEALDLIERDGINAWTGADRVPEGDAT